jgi:hypothetical protein
MSYLRMCIQRMTLPQSIRGTMGKNGSRVVSVSLFDMVSDIYAI